MRLRRRRWIIITVQVSRYTWRVSRGKRPKGAIRRRATLDAHQHQDTFPKRGTSNRCFPLPNGECNCGQACYACRGCGVESPTLFLLRLVRSKTLYDFWHSQKTALSEGAGLCPTNPQGTCPLTHIRGSAPSPVLGGARGNNSVELLPHGRGLRSIPSRSVSPLPLPTVVPYAPDTLLTPFSLFSISKHRNTPKSVLRASRGL